jgi:hypothetical protein
MVERSPFSTFHLVGLHVGVIVRQVQKRCAYWPVGQKA